MSGIRSMENGDKNNSPFAYLPILCASYNGDCFTAWPRMASVWYNSAQLYQTTYHLSKSNRTQGPLADPFHPFQWLSIIKDSSEKF